MLNKILKNIRNEYIRFLKREFVKYFGVNLDIEPFTNLFVKFWKSYYIENNLVISNRLEVLKENLDDESKFYADLLFKRYIELHPDSDFTNNAILKTNIYTDYELTLQKKYGNIKLSGLEYLPSTDYIEGKDIIDGGAFTGDSAIDFIKYNPNKIYSFEPTSESFNILNQIKNKNIIPIKKGLGEKNKTIKICYCGSGSTLLTSDAGSESIEIVTIDDFVEQNKLNPGLIKLDIEGYELEAIEGALKTIEKFKPLLIISIYHHPKDFFEIKPKIEQMDLGYKFTIRKLAPYCIFSEYALIGHL